MSNDTDLTALHIWREDTRPDEYGIAAGPISQQALDMGELVLPQIPGGPIEGAYKRAEPLVEQLIAQDPLGSDAMPVFVHTNWVAYTKSRQHIPGGIITDEPAAIEHVRQGLEDACNIAVKKGHISISSIITTGNSTNGHPTMIEGHVALIRPR